MRNMELPQYTVEPAYTGAPEPGQPAARAETVIEKAFSSGARRDSDHQLAGRILTRLFEKRRLLPEDETDGLRETPDFESEAGPHMDRLLRAIRQNRPVNLILPAFPAKSPNRNKTLGHLPDLAEKHALENLKSLCDSIGAVYEPGAKITICSDGRVFADLVCIPDEDVTAYGEYLRNYAAAAHGDRFAFFNLEDAFQKTYSYDILREELLILYGESIASLYQRCKEEKEARAMYLGITRFIFEDYSGIEPFCSGSRTAIQKVARLIAYRVIQRSNAWSRLLEDRFPDALRLSIHPQFRVSKKIGVYLGDTNGDDWLTPWHSVAVRHNGKISFSKRKDAEGCGMLAFDEGRPSHFEILDLDDPMPMRNSKRGDTPMTATAKNNVPNLSPLQPFGMLVYAPRAGMTLLDIPASAITDWLERHGLLVFRGYELLADEDYIAFAERFGPLLQWEFGKILELKVQPRPANHIFTAGRVELHWDGAFVDNKPHYNVFQCLQGCAADAGGQTLFVDTSKVLATASAELAAWRKISIEYVTEKKAHYGGTIRSPLIARNPYNGREVIRYIEAFNEDNAEINPMRVSVENFSNEMSDRFLREFTSRLYRGDVMYRHTWQSGDFLIADNATLLHGRSRFNTADVTRHIKRINIL